jgi:hypothetical protein
VALTTDATNGEESIRLPGNGPGWVRMHRTE